ncbi:MAG: ComEC/Rec2 family competence protein [Haliscomenobacter sp.]|nr:ComEC/Rec2 family competence protein [Haliscomenobacter sp.]
MNWREFPFLTILLVFSLGILASEYGSAWIPPSGGVLPILAGAAGLAVWTGFQKLAYRLAFLFSVWCWAAFFLLGVWRRQSIAEGPPSGHFERLHLEQFYGKVLVEEAKTGKNSWRVFAQVLTAGPNPDTQYAVRGSVLLYLKPEGHKIPSAGELLAVAGRLSRIPDNSNPEAFNYAAYLRRQGIHFQAFVPAAGWMALREERVRGWKAVLFSGRAYCLKQLRNALPDPQRYAIGAALILGNRERLDREVLNAFSKTGAMHILSVSGLHVGMVAWCLSWILGKVPLPGRWGMAVRSGTQLGGIWGYAILCGAGASVLRAAVMFSWLLMGKTINRPGNIWNTLSGSAFMLLLYNPQWLFDIGFQLSYLAVAGIVLLEPPVYRLLHFKTLAADYFWKMTAVGIAAQLATGPLSVFYFHQFPTWFWLSGWVAVPLGAAVQGLGLALVVLGGVPGVPWSLGWLLDWSIRILFAAMEQMLFLPLACIEGLWLEPWEALWWYLLLGAAAIAFFRPQKIWIWILACLIATGAGARFFFRLDQAETREVICFAVGKSSVTEFWNGRDAVVFQAGDTAQILSQTRAFHLKKKPDRISQRTLQEKAASGNLPQSGPLVVFNGKRFFFWDGEGGKDILPPEGADYWILRNSPFLPKKGLEGRMPAQLVIADGSNDPGKRKYYARFFKDNKVVFWSTPDQGAWKKNF